jgi:co-chaperonin GroES (HSP10)
MQLENVITKILRFIDTRVEALSISVTSGSVDSQCGLVLAMGPDCYRDKERYPDGPWCKVNDWIMFARYAGSRIKIDGGEIRLLNDDEVLATIDSPEDILHEF